MTNVFLVKFLCQVRQTKDLPWKKVLYEQWKGSERVSACLCDSRLLSTGQNAKGESVYLRDVWPTREEIHAVESKHVIPAMFREVCIVLISF